MKEVRGGDGGEERRERQEEEKREEWELTHNHYHFLSPSPPPESTSITVDPREANWREIHFGRSAVKRHAGCEPRWNVRKYIRVFSLGSSSLAFSPKHNQQMYVVVGLTHHVLTRPDPSFNGQ